jgi:putative membrane protein insertion efficiency factor
VTSSTLRPYQPGWWLQRLILLYRKLLSPIMGRNCRYLPTCSEYAYESIEEHGAIKGTWMSLRRLGRCHPWHEGGFDPVPKKVR